MEDKKLKTLKFIRDRMKYVHCENENYNYMITLGEIIDDYSKSGDKYPINGFAPGAYNCTCGSCNKTFSGHKRAVRCYDCAVGGDSIKPLNEGLVGENPFNGEKTTTKLRWSENAGPTPNVSYYDHTICKTPIGRFIIEWKSWKSSPSYDLMFDEEWIGVGNTLDEAKKLAVDFLVNKHQELMNYLNNNNDEI
jgi:hypothetical protein